MQRIFDEAGFAGRFYMADLDEPVHVHVFKDGKEAKFWTSPINCAKNNGLSRKELRKAEDLVQKYLQDILTLWHQAEEARKNAGRTG